MAFCRAGGCLDPVGMAQDAFAELWLSRARFKEDWRDDAAVGAWLRGIARNLLAADARRAAQRPRSIEDHDVAAPDGSEALDRVARIRAGIDELSEDLRTPLIMCALEGSPVKRVAALLDLPAKTVEGRLYRARKALGELLSGAMKEQGS